MPIATGNANESLLALVDGKWVNLRVPYPMGFYAKWMDGRIDDPNGGWKGRGLWSTYRQPHAVPHRRRQGHAAQGGAASSCGPIRWRGERVPSKRPTPGAAPAAPGHLQTRASHQGERHMSVLLNRVALAALACLIAAPAGAQLIQRKDLSYAMAKTIAENALADCKARGYAVSVVVVDRGGDTIVALRADDAGPHTMENARRKAYTARTFRMTTEEFVKRMETEPVRRQQTTLPHVIAIGGGVPIKVGNDVIGGVGLSGSPGVDEPCVNAGIDKVKDQLQ